MESMDSDCEQLASVLARNLPFIFGLVGRRRGSEEETTSEVVERIVVLDPAMQRMIVIETDGGSGASLEELAAAGPSVYYLGCNPGLFIVGLFGNFVVWLYGNLWITGVMIMVGGYLFSLKYARMVIFMTTLYALYLVKVRVGWHEIFLSLNLASLSNDFLSYLFQVCESAEASPHFKEEKESKPNFEDYSGDAGGFSHASEPEKVSSNKSSGINSSSSNVDVKPATSASSNVKIVSYPLDEMKRILNSSDHYEALGFPRHKHIDVGVLKKEYRMKAVLVHPDKNLGSPLASESFKKLQCAYEVLSDLEKKKTYDGQFRREEFMTVSQKPCKAYENCLAESCLSVKCNVGGIFLATTHRTLHHWGLAEIHRPSIPFTARSPIASTATKCSGNLNVNTRHEATAAHFHSNFGKEYCSHSDMANELLVLAEEFWQKNGSRKLKSLPLLAAQNV